MRFFDYSFIKEYALPIGRLETLCELYLTEERIQLWLQLYPNAMSMLRKQRIIDDINSTHTIERMSADKLDVTKIIESDSKPTNIDEMKVMGQFEAIAYWESLVTKDNVEPEDILGLHRSLMVRHDGNAGKYRSKDFPHIGYGTATTIKKPANTKETRYALHQFCKSYNESSHDSSLNKLALAICSTVDYFSISPFDNGNGRMYRMILAMFLERAGITTHLYSSLEKQILLNLDNHFTALRMSTNGWNGDFYGYDAFINDIVYDLHQCTIELNRSFPKPSAGKVSKTDRIRYVIEQSPSDFTLEYVCRHAPDISKVLIHNTLSDMVKEKIIEKRGNTRGVSYSRAKKILNNFD